MQIENTRDETRPKAGEIVAPQLMPRANSEFIKKKKKKEIVFRRETDAFRNRCAADSDLILS